MDKKFEELKKLAEAAKGTWGRERDEFEGMATPTVVLELIALARLATEEKPSASAAPGIDTPEFSELLAACGDCMTASDREQEYATARAALVSHIDAAIAAAQEEGRHRGRWEREQETHKEFCNMSAEIVSLRSALRKITTEGPIQSVLIATKALAAQPKAQPTHETIVQEGAALVCTACGTTAQPTPEESAKAKWNAEADQHNQWSELGQDEKDSLIAAQPTPPDDEPVAYLKEWKSVGNAQQGMRKLDFTRESETWLANMFPTVTPLYRRAALRHPPVPNVGEDERARIRSAALACGFTIKEGLTDLKPYVYDFAAAMIAIGRGDALRDYVASAAPNPDAGDAALTTGYESGKWINQDLGGTVVLHYESPAEAKSAFEYISARVAAATGQAGKAGA